MPWLRQNALFFLLIIKLVLPLRLLRQDLEKLHILVSLLPLRLLQRDSGKKHYLDSTLTTFSFLPYPRFLLPLPWHDQGNSFFDFFATFTTLWSKEKKLIWSLRSLRHNLRVKKVFFSFSHHLHYGMIKKKNFFHVGTTLNIPWSQKKKFDFYWTTTLTTLRSWKKCSILFHWDFHYRNIFLRYLTSTYNAHTSLTCRKNSQTKFSPEKTCVTWKTFFFRNFSGVLHDLLLVFFYTCRTSFKVLEYLQKLKTSKITFFSWSEFCHWTKLTTKHVF